eukprot:CAMPEP_0178901974 /NCGR_PEP_ID=MMETSP0786-20121207/4341_1 /TAXON_ID=186022 /ORGANISM="Thalassionema frauenfeldii, Strain CCMP 1798" /LENGTH=908 /DNA_ID=CAMNT_0020573177 /DNA_START=177 /DNA_END=2903 /DNA_ORIENTATION=-
MCSETFQATSSSSQSETFQATSSASPSPSRLIIQPNSLVSTSYGIGKVLDYRSKDHIYKVQLDYGTLYTSSCRIDDADQEALASFVKEELNHPEEESDDDDVAEEEENDVEEIVKPGSRVETIYGPGVVQECRDDETIPICVIQLSFGILYMPQSQILNSNRQQNETNTNEFQTQAILNELLLKKKQKTPCMKCLERMSHWKQLVQVYQRTQQRNQQKKNPVMTLVVDQILLKPRRGQPCWLCGTPTCKKHSCPTFRKEGNNMTVCQDCTKLFSFQFVLDMIPMNNSKNKEEERLQIQQQQLQQMMETYDRAYTLLQYALPLVEKIASALEGIERGDNRVALGSSSLGFMSGLLGVAAAITLFTPAAPIVTPPLVSAAFLTSSSSTAVTTQVQLKTFFSQANRLANRIIALHGMCQSIVRIRNILERVAEVQLEEEVKDEQPPVNCEQDDTETVQLRAENTDSDSTLIKESHDLKQTNQAIIMESNPKNTTTTDTNASSSFMLLQGQSQRRQTCYFLLLYHLYTKHIPRHISEKDCTIELLEDFPMDQSLPTLDKTPSSRSQLPRWMSAPNMFSSSSSNPFKNFASMKSLRMQGTTKSNNTAKKEIQQENEKSTNGKRNLNNNKTMFLNYIMSQLTHSSATTSATNGSRKKRTKTNTDASACHEKKEEEDKEESMSSTKNAAGTKTNLSAHPLLSARNLFLPNDNSSSNEDTATTPPRTMQRSKQKELESTKIMDLAKVVNSPPPPSPVASVASFIAPTKVAENKDKTDNSSSDDTLHKKEEDTQLKLRGKYATFIARTSANAAGTVAQSLVGALSMFDLASLTGGTMSFYVIWYEAKSIKDTIQNMKQGNPCEKAAQLRAIRDESAPKLLQQSALKKDCEEYLQVLNDRTEPYQWEEIMKALSELKT